MGISPKFYLISYLAFFQKKNLDDLDPVKGQGLKEEKDF
jgi:hypothetical protein